MARVSSDEQAKNYSLGAQQEALERYCQKLGISISYMIKEDHSAKDFNRPEFIKFMKLVKSSQLKIDLLLFITWDRFSRNASESFMVIKELNKFGISPEAIDQPLDLSIPENKMMLSFYITLPEVDNDRRSIKTKTGIYAALKTGRFTAKAPLGYKNSRDEYNKPIIILSEKAEAIRYVFKQTLKGESQAQIRKDVYKRFNVNITKARISALLRNKFYAGYVHLPAHGGNPAEWIEAIHDPIVSLSDFNTIQQLLARNANKQGILKPKALREELHLRGILECEVCGSHITGSASRSKTGKQHFYYHCNHCKSTRFKAEEANEWAQTLLSSFKIQTNANELYQKIKADVVNERKKQLPKSIDTNKLQQDIEKLEGKQSEIRNKYLMDEISVDQFSEMDAMIKDKMDAIQELLGKSPEKNEQLKALNEFLQCKIEEALNIEKNYTNSNVNQRLRILSSIFKSKLIFSKKQSRTPELKEEIELILLKDSVLQKQKTGQLVDDNQMSRLVAETRIELSPLCHFNKVTYLYKRSKSLKALSLAHFVFSGHLVRISGHFFSRLSI